MRPAVPRHLFDSQFTLDDAQSAAADLLSATGENGVYLWGPVGRGKTWLLDRYFGAVETPRKKRVHFHSFFRDLHASYFRHGFSIDAAIDELLDGAQLLCFDEFHVHDIGDARIITRMLDALLARQVTLVVTSNYEPEGLLSNPLFHEAFVPTIDALRKNLNIVHVDGPMDYRTQRTTASRFASGIWTTEPSDNGRTFDELCCEARSTGDYLDITEHAHELTITQIPPLADVGEFAAQRFSNLVDVLYDRDIRTNFHAHVALEQFAEGCSGLDIDRIVSRLGQLASPAGPAEIKGDTHC